MARAWLRDDTDACGVYAGRDRSGAIVCLDDDRGCGPCGCGGTSDFPPDPGDGGGEVPPGGQHTLTVRLRTRTGYDDDGNPMFEWRDVVTGLSISFEEREEFDAVAGLTNVVATATMLYKGPEFVKETASVVREDGIRYRVTGMSQTGDLLRMTLARIDQ